MGSALRYRGLYTEAQLINVERCQSNDAASFDLCMACVVWRLVSHQHATFSWIHSGPGHRLLPPCANFLHQMRRSPFDVELAHADNGAPELELDQYITLTIVIQPPDQHE